MVPYIYVFTSHVFFFFSIFSLSSPFLLPLIFFHTLQCLSAFWILKYLSIQAWFISTELYMSSSLYHSPHPQCIEWDKKTIKIQYNVRAGPRVKFTGLARPLEDKDEPPFTKEGEMQGTSCLHVLLIDKTSSFYAFWCHQNVNGQHNGYCGFLDHKVNVTC